MTCILRLSLTEIFSVSFRVCGASWAVDERDCASLIAFTRVLSSFVQLRAIHVRIPSGDPSLILM